MSIRSPPEPWCWHITLLDDRTSLPYSHECQGRSPLAATLTADEARKQGVIEIVAGDVHDLLVQADGRKAPWLANSAPSRRVVGSCDGGADVHRDRDAEIEPGYPSWLGMEACALSGSRGREGQHHQNMGYGVSHNHHGVTDLEGGKVEQAASLGDADRSSRS